jgi:polysaccharide export outer membrane protein
VEGVPTVEVAEYAPVFVLGAVERPGPHPYRPGMIALELVALGGGLRRAPAGDGGALRTIALEQELGDLRIQLYGQGVRRARLVAETADQDFAGPAPPAQAVDEETRRRVHAAEVALFQVRRAAAAGQERALKAQRASYDQEIASLVESIRHHDEEVKLIADETAVQEGLFAKGLSVQTRVLALKRELSSTRRNALDLRLSLARARQRQLEIDQRLGELRDGRLKENAEALRELDLETARTARRMEAAAAAVLQSREDTLQEADARGRPPVLTVVRQEGERFVNLPTDVYGPLKPRDILRVDPAPSIRGAARGPGPAGGPT